VALNTSLLELRRRISTNPFSVPLIRGPSLFVQLKAPFQNQPAGARIDVSDADGQLFMKSGIAEAVAGDPLADAFARHTAAVPLTSLRSVPDSDMPKNGGRVLGRPRFTTYRLV
jgi:hypothetical protein